MNFTESESSEQNRFMSFISNNNQAKDVLSSQGDQGNTSPIQVGSIVLLETNEELKPIIFPNIKREFQRADRSQSSEKLNESSLKRSGSCIPNEKYLTSHVEFEKFSNKKNNEDKNSKLKVR